MSENESPDNEANIVLLAVAQSEVEGMMLADTVRRAGIKVLLKSGGPGMGAWASAATFEHRLYVTEDRLAEAQAVLASASGRSGARARRAAPRVNPRSRRTPG